MKMLYIAGHVDLSNAVFWAPHYIKKCEIIL